MKNKKLVMIPGPTPVLRSIQDQMGRETVAFKDPDFVNDFKSVVKDLKELWKTSGEVFVIAGSGTLGMEMAVCNTVQKGDSILIISHGYFGDRFTELCERKGLDIDVISSEWGKVVPVEDIKAKLESKNYKAVTVTHVDTATGVMADIEAIGDVVKDFEDTMFIVDGVCATAAAKEYVDEMHIDILLTGTQKAFGVAPGLTMLWASEKAMARRESLGMIPEYYADFNKWLPIMHDPMKYFGTPAVNLIWALQESIRIIKEEGIDNRYDRHEKNANAMQKAVEALGFSILAEKGYRAVSLSNCLYPEGINDAEFRQVLADEGIVVAGGLGPYAGKLFRLGHMGNIDTHDMVSVIATIERALYKVGYPVKFGTGVGVLLENLM